MWQLYWTCCTAAGSGWHPEKSVFGAALVSYLGHAMSESGLTPQEAKIKAVKEMKAPLNQSELRVGLGRLGRVGRVRRLGRVGRVRRLGRVGRVRRLGRVGRVGRLRSVGAVGWGVRLLREAM